MFPTKSKNFRRRQRQQQCRRQNWNNNKRKVKHEIIAIKMLGLSSDTKKKTKKKHYSTNWKPRREREREKESHRGTYNFNNDFEYHSARIYFAIAILEKIDRRTVNDHHAHKTNILVVFVCAPAVFILCTALHLLYQITGYYDESSTTTMTEI